MSLSPDISARASATLETIIKALALELSTAAADLDTAASDLRDAGKGRQANRAKQAAMKAQAMADGWLG